MISKIPGGPSAGPGICCLMTTSQPQWQAERLLTMSGPFIDLIYNFVWKLHNSRQTNVWINGLVVVSFYDNFLPSSYLRKSARFLFLINNPCT